MHFSAIKYICKEYLYPVTYRCILILIIQKSAAYTVSCRSTDTTFSGLPCRKLFKLSTAISISRFLDSLEAHAICGVIIMFGAVISGLSSLTGSSDTTSTAAPATFPLSRASFKSFSTIKGPLESLIMRTPSFILAIVSQLMIPLVPEFKGQCRQITSDTASSSSRSAYRQCSVSSSFRQTASNTFISIPSASAILAVFWPILPNPMIPIVFPDNSVNG